MSPSGPGYTVALSGAVRELLTRLRDRAAADGRRAEFIAAVRSVLERLRDDP